MDCTQVELTQIFDHVAYLMKRFEDDNDSSKPDSLDMYKANFMILNCTI